MLKISIDLLIYMKEQWKDIADFDNYEVSDLGNVRNKTTGKILKPLKKNGYLYVDLYNNGDSKHKYIHRLVANSFIPNPLNLPQVNHKDCNRANNNVDNVEWCSAQYNNEYFPS